MSTLQLAGCVVIEMTSSIEEENRADAMRIARDAEIIQKVMADLSAQVGSHSEPLSIVEQAVDTASKQATQGAEHLEAASVAKNSVRWSRVCVAFLTLIVVAGIAYAVYCRVQ